MSKPATPKTLAAVERTLPGIDLSAYIVTETSKGVTMSPNPDHAFWQQDKPVQPPTAKRPGRVWTWKFETSGQPFTKKEG